RTLPSAEPKPVMLRGTDFKASRSVREQPSHPVKLIVARVVEPGHVAAGRERRVALDPEDGHAGDADLDVQLPERLAGKRARRPAPHGQADRRERIAARLADLDADPVTIATERAGDVEGALQRVGGIDGRLEVAGPRDVAVHGEAGGEREARRDVGAVAGPPQAVAGAAHVAPQRELRERTPTAACLELPGPRLVQGPECEAQVGARPRARDLEAALGEVAVEHGRVAAGARRRTARLCP